jgi:predicted nucleic acid-binding protein
MEDERVSFWPEPAAVSAILPRLLRYPSPAPELVTDAYVVAFALAKAYRLATFDGGFSNFRVYL